MATFSLLIYVFVEGVVENVPLRCVFCLGVKDIIKITKKDKAKFTNLAKVIWLSFFAIIIAEVIFMNAIIRSDLNYFSMNGIKPNFFDKNS